MFERISTMLEDLKRHKGFLKYFKNTSWLLGEKILRIFAGLFVTVWMARYLGPEQFGLFTYAQSFVFFFTIMATLGLDSIVVRELVHDKNLYNKLLGSAFSIKLIGAIIVLIILSLAVQLTDNDNPTNLLIFVIATSIIFQSFNVIDFYCQSQVVSKYVALANSISLFVSSIVKITLILYEAPLITFAYVIVFESLVLASGLIYFYIKNLQLKIFNWRFDWKICKNLLKDSWPLVFSGILISIYMKIDQIMIKEILGLEDNGQYAAAVTLSEAFYFIPMVVASSLFPAIINAKKNNKKLYVTRLRRFYSLMIWLAIAIAIPTTFLSDWIVNLLYGDQYYQASGVLTIHIWASIFVFMGVANGKWLINENLQFFSMIYTVIGVVTNIVLNYILIRKIGIEGAAWATIISQFIATYFCLLLFKKTRVSFFRLSKSLFLVNTLNINKK
jgi:O-antigen/teichoic acid export membrane protein